MNDNIKLLTLVFFLLITAFGADTSQAREPITFEGITKLPDFGLDPSQIADQISESGLAFEVTKAHIDSLQKLGFGSTVINAIKQFYTMGFVKIATQPAKVKITLDEQTNYKSDNSGLLEIEIPRGVHSLQLEKGGYEKVDTTITVIKDKSISVKINLKQKSGSTGESKFYGRYGASLGFGLSFMNPEFDDDSKWESGNNLIVTAKANLMPYLFVDADVNVATFSEFDAGDGEDFGYLSGITVSVIPGVYKEYKENYRGYIGLGLEINSTKIENGKYTDDGVAYLADEKGSKTSFASVIKLGADAFVYENLFLFGEIRAYSVLSQYSMSFFAIGAGMYLK